jgi:hypothetical protein
MYRTTKNIYLYNVWLLGKLFAILMKVFSQNFTTSDNFLMGGTCEMIRSRTRLA